MNLTKPTKIRSKKITQSAKGENCTLRIGGVCNHNSETTIFAHLKGNKGTGTKNHDLFGIYCCSSCHDFLDDRHTLPIEAHHGWDVLRALQETQLKLVAKNLITIK